MGYPASRCRPDGGHWIPSVASLTPQAAAGVWNDASRVRWEQHRFLPLPPCADTPTVSDARGRFAQPTGESYVLVSPWRCTCVHYKVLDPQTAMQYSTLWDFCTSPALRISSLHPCAHELPRYRASRLPHLPRCHSSNGNTDDRSRATGDEPRTTQRSGSSLNAGEGVPTRHAGLRHVHVRTAQYVPFLARGVAGHQTAMEQRRPGIPWAYPLLRQSQGGM